MPLKGERRQHADVAERSVSKNREHQHAAHDAAVVIQDED